MNNTELKPCPFCGGEVTIALKGNKHEQWFVTRGIGKKKCTCRVFMESNLFSKDDSETIKGKEKDKLIEKWNTRKPMDNIVAELEKAGNYNDKFLADNSVDVIHGVGYCKGIRKAIDIVKAGGFK